MKTEQRLNKLADAGKIYWYRIEDGVASIASKSNELILQKNEASK